MKQILAKAFATAALMASANAKAQLGLSFSVKTIPQFNLLQNGDDNGNGVYGNKAVV